MKAGVSTPPGIGEHVANIINMNLLERLRFLWKAYRMQYTVKLKGVEG